MIIKGYFQGTVTISETDYEELLDVKKKYEIMSDYIMNSRSLGSAVTTIYPLVNLITGREMWDESTKDPIVQV